jgi:hypothetical protein
LFDKGFKSGNILQCTVTGNLAFASLKSGKNLLWQQVFAYANAEDIAYQVKAAAQYHGLDNLIVRMAADNVSLHTRMEELKTYFPELQMGGDHVKEEGWKPVVNLAQQLYTCV